MPVLCHATMRATASRLPGSRNELGSQAPWVPSVPLLTSRLYLRQILPRGWINWHRHGGMHECPCVSDLVKEVSDTEGPRPQLPLFVLPGKGLEAGGDSRRIVSDDRKLNTFSRELFDFLEGGSEDDDTGSGPRAPA